MKKITIQFIALVCFSFFTTRAQQIIGQKLLMSSQSVLSKYNPPVLKTRENKVSKTTASFGNKKSLVNCTDKINYMGNTSQYYFQIGSALPISSNYHHQFLLQVFPDYEGEVKGVEFNAATFGSASKNLVVGVYQVNSSGIPFGGWIESATVSISSSANLYTATFSTPATVTAGYGFAIGLFFGPGSPANDSVKAFVAPQLPVSAPQLSYVLANNVIEDFPTYYGSSYNAHALIRPIVTTSVNSSWVSAKTSTGCGIPAVYVFTNTTQPFVSSYVTNTLICPGGITKVLDYGDGSPVVPNFNTSPPRTHSYTTIGNYDAEFTQTYVGWTNNCAQSKTIVVSVDNPLPSFTYNTNGLSVMFTNTSQNLSTYSWNFGDLSTSTQSDPSHTFSSPGTYVVELEGTAPCGKVRYSASVIVSAGTSIQKNGSINNLISIFPNPAVNSLQIKNKSQDELDSKIEIFNSIGTSVKIIINSGVSESISIDVSDLSKGIYFIKLKSKKGDLVKSFVKE